jgi:hypothetical protein
VLSDDLLSVFAILYSLEHVSHGVSVEEILTVVVDSEISHKVGVECSGYSSPSIYALRRSLDNRSHGSTVSNRLISGFCHINIFWDLYFPLFGSLLLSCPVEGDRKA